MEPDGTVREENEKIGETSSVASPSPQEKARNAKAIAILDVCKKKYVKELRIFATSEGGLVSDEVRRQACSCHPEADKTHG